MITKSIKKWKMGETISESEMTIAARHITWQIAAALNHCHSSGIWQRDVKPDNILIMDDSETRPRAVLADFGSACRVGAGELVRMDQAGTDHYWAPEL
jgi:serine/threonine protein kinase